MNILALNSGLRNVEKTFGRYMDQINLFTNLMPCNFSFCLRYPLQTVLRTRSCALMN